MRNHKLATAIVSCAFLFVLGAGVVLADSPDDKINEQSGNQNAQYLNAQPVPFYDWSAMRQQQLDLYQVLITGLPNTWTVARFMGTDLSFTCASRGYPLPFGMSLTAPEYPKHLDNGSHEDATIPMPQAEPYGLYNNDVTTDGTWVFCVNDDGSLSPVYTEPDAMAFPFPVEVQGNQIVRVGGAPSVAFPASNYGS